MNIGEDEKQIQSIVIELLQDNLDDMKKIIKRMQVTIIFLILLIVGIACYYEYSFKKFLSQYDIGATATFDLDSENGSLTTNNGNINIGK